MGNFALTTYFYYAKAELGIEILGSVHGVVFRKTLTAQSAICDKSEVCTHHTHRAYIPVIHTHHTHQYSSHCSVYTAFSPDRVKFVLRILIIILIPQISSLPLLRAHGVSVGTWCCCGHLVLLRALGAAEGTSTNYFIIQLLSTAYLPQKYLFW